MRPSNLRKLLWKLYIFIPTKYFPFNQYQSYVVQDSFRSYKANINDEVMDSHSFHFSNGLPCLVWIASISIVCGPWLISTDKRQTLMMRSWTVILPTQQWLATSCLDCSTFASILQGIITANVTRMSNGESRTESSGVFRSTLLFLMVGRKTPGKRQD